VIHSCKATELARPLRAGVCSKQQRAEASNGGSSYHRCKSAVLNAPCARRKLLHSSGAPLARLFARQLLKPQPRIVAAIFFTPLLQPRCFFSQACFHSGLLLSAREVKNCLQGTQLTKQQQQQKAAEKQKVSSVLDPLQSRAMSCADGRRMVKTR